MSAGYTIVNTPSSLTAGLGKSIVGVVMGANAPLRLVEMGVSFNGIAAAAVPAVVELCSSTQVGVGTSTNAPPVQVRGQARNVQSTGSINYSGEPSTLTILKSWYVPVFNGTFAIQFPLGREIDTLTTTRPALFLRVTAPAAVSVLGYFEIEEGG